MSHKFYGLKEIKAQIENLRKSGDADDPRLALASQSIEAAIHWLSQPPVKPKPEKETKNDTPQAS